jgi:hypothetical protein
MHDDAFYIAHHIELRPNDRLVFAEPKGFGNGDRCWPECADGSKLSAHVVSSRQDMAEGPAPQHRCFAICAGDPKGEVRVPAWQLMKAQRTRDLGYVLGEPGGNLGYINPGRSRFVVRRGRFNWGLRRRAHP